MNDLGCWRLQNLLKRAGLVKLGLVVLAGLLVTTGRAQMSFATAQVLTGNWGSVTNDNTPANPTGAPNTAGFPTNAPIWYQWTAPANGEVELDTVGTTNILDTVLAVYMGNSLTSLSQVAANDDLFPINSSISQETISGSGDYAQLPFLLVNNLVSGYVVSPLFEYYQPYYGPSHLRFNATAGTTYYFEEDTKSPSKGKILLHWAYKSSGVFRFATEDFDPSTGLPLYQASETESSGLNGLDDSLNSAVLTYYTYNVPGVLVTVTRVAGSSGRCTVGYKTEDGNFLPRVPTNDLPAVAGTDYRAVSGTLVFDDYEMSKTIRIPIINAGTRGSGSFTNNTFFGIILTNAQLDPYESGNVSQPRLDSTFSTALVKILNPNASPYGPETVQVVSTNGFLDPPTDSQPILATNYPIVPPTNALFSFEKANYRVPADVNGTNSPWTQVTLWVERFGTNTASAAINYRINNVLGYDQNNEEEMNILFPLQPGSDYAVPTPPTWSPVRGTNSDFNMVQGTITFPGSPSFGWTLQPITFTVPTSSLTKFNKDFKIQLYQEINGAPQIVGMVSETTVTILFNDLNPPAGSVDELYNPDFNNFLALPPNLIPQTTPQGDPNPGVSGVVNSLAVLNNNETIIAGDFVSYNGNTLMPGGNPINNIALIDVNGQLDSAFAPNSGANAPINAVATSTNGQYVIGGDFTSFNGQTRNYVARVNTDGSLDMSFNPSADGTVWATAMQPDGKVLIGGDFTHVNGQTRDYLARLNADGSLDTAFNPGTTLNGPVYALALPPIVVLNLSRIANGGPQEDDQVLNLGNLNSGTLTVLYDMFTVPDDMRIFYGDTNVAAGTGVLIYDTGYISGTNVLVIPFGPTNGTNGLLTTNLITIVMNQGGSSNLTTAWIYSASVSVPQTPKGILVGGQFNVAGQDYANIARFNPTNGLLDTSFNPIMGPDQAVRALGWQLNDQIVAGGVFTHVNGRSFNHIARFNPDGSLDSTNFFIGTGANDIVWNLTLQPLDGTIYVGGQFSSFNGTHRLGFTRLYANGTVDTTFMDTAYNQFAGLKRIYSDPFPNAAPIDTPAVYVSGVQSDGNVMIGGSFQQVGGGQADINVCNTLDEELGIQESFNDSNLWVEPKTRDGVRNRSSLARLIGGSTPGPGNIGLQNTAYSANKSQNQLSVGLVRTNGTLGPIAANFSVLPELAKGGIDYSYDSTPPLYWIASQFIVHPSRGRGDGLFGISRFLQDIYGLYLTSSDLAINNLSAVTVGIKNNKQTLGNLDAQFQLANPSGADTFYLGAENIPLCAALGLGGGGVPFTLIDNNKQSGVFGFTSTNYIATSIYTGIGLVRSNGTYGTVTMLASTADGTAIAGTDYNGITNLPVVFGGGVVTNSFTVTNDLNGIIYTNFVEKFLNLHLTALTGPSDGYAVFGLSNAVLRLINPNFQGYLTLSATNYTNSQSAGFVSFVVNRVVGSAGTLTVQYATTNNSAANGATNQVDFYGVTNTLQWNNGDVSPRVVNVRLVPNGTVGANKQFGVYLLNPTNGLTFTPSLFYTASSPGSITNATLTINNDNSYGAFQFSASSYVVNENGGSATITVIRTGGTNGSVLVSYATANGTAVAPGNYTTTSGTLTFSAGQTAASFTVPIVNDNVPDPANFSFTVTLSSPSHGVLGSPSSATVNILDVQTYNRPPGSPDGTFNFGMNGDVLALALQTNGQILAGGNFTAVNGASENYIARLNSDGSLDNTGFLNGLAGADGTVQAVVCQTDGRVIIGGSFTSVDGIFRNYIARLMTDGSLDTTFNPGPGASGPVYSLAETFTNGLRGIYVGGAFSTISGDYSPNFARLNNNGTLDTTFAIGSGPSAPVYAIAVYPTNSTLAGSVLIGGAFTNVNGFALNHIARLNVNGSVDTNFDLNMGANDAIRAIVIQNDGRILIGGDFTSIFTNNVNGVALNHIARLNNDGTLDTNFTANVTNNIDGGVNGSVQAIAVQADNQIVLAGQFTHANGVTRNHITRLMTNGVVDPTINFGDGANGAIDALVIQPADQMLVIGGGFTQYDDQPASHIARIYGGSVTGGGLLQFTSAAYQVDEKGAQALITIERTGGTSGGVSVTFATSDGSAVAGVNYTAVSSTVNFPSGEVFETVAVPVLYNAITSNLTVNLALSTNGLATPGEIGLQPTAVLTILSDATTVSFSAANYSVAKNVATGFAPIDVLRFGATNGTSSVDFITTTNGTALPGVDFYPTNTTITFNPGDTDKQVQVPIINNNLPEGNRTVTFILTNVVNTALVSPSNATLTIIDTVNAPGQLSFSAGSYTVNESDGTAYITVTRVNGTSGTVTVAYNTVAGTATPGVSYFTTSGTLTFNAGDTSKTFAVPFVQNNLVLGTVNFSVVLSNPTGGATLVAPTSAIVNILDKNIGFAFATATTTVRESAGFATVNVLRIGATNGTVSVNYTTVDGTATAGVNYIGSTNIELDFANGVSSRSINVPLIHDPQVTGDLNFTIALSNPTGGVIVAPGTNTVIVQDADAGLSFTTNASSVYKNAGSAVIAVVCSNPGVEPLFVDYSTTNNGTAVPGVDYVSTHGRLTFTGGVVTNTFSVPIIGNSSLNGNHTFTVSLTNTALPGELVSPTNQLVTIVNNNVGLSFSSPTYTVLRNGVGATITVVRTDNTNTTSTVNFATADGTAVAGVDYVATNGILTFASGQTSNTFTVMVLTNTPVQPDKTVFLQLSTPVNGILIPPYAATLTIRDNRGSSVVPAGSALASESYTPANGIIDPGETVSLLFAFRVNGGTNNVADLQATLLATNGITSPSAGAPYYGDYGQLITNGPSVSRPFTFTASSNYASGQQIVATFQLTNVVNGVGTNLGTALFTYTLGTWTVTYSSTTPIIINDDMIATPYPSTINVSSLGGVITKATVTLTNLSHQSLNDVSVLVVSPDEQDTLLMQHVGTPGIPVNHLTLTFDDSAVTNLPGSSYLPITITNGTYKPTFYPPATIFP